jgi:hypothetical protein
MEVDGELDTALDTRLVNGVVSVRRGERAASDFSDRSCRRSAGGRRSRCVGHTIWRRRRTACDCAHDDRRHFCVRRCSARSLHAGSRRPRIPAVDARSCGGGRNGSSRGFSGHCGRARGRTGVGHGAFQFDETGPDCKSPWPFAARNAGERRHTFRRHDPRSRHANADCREVPRPWHHDLFSDGQWRQRSECTRVHRR